MAANYRSLDTLKGKVLEEVTDTIDTQVLTFTDGSRVEFYHEQNCCENVYIKDHVFPEKGGEGYEPYYGLGLESITIDDTDVGGDYNSATETVITYKFIEGDGQSTTEFKTYWLGESNGYYSESVDYRIVDEGE